MIATLVGSIMAPSIAFGMLAKHLKENGVEVRTLIGNGKPVGLSVREIKELVIGSNVVLAGMSVPAEYAREELWAAETAAINGIPFGLYADTYGVPRRDWFRFLREEANFLFVLDEEERREARELCPKAEVVASGNPTFEDFFSPKFTKQEVRARLGIRDLETALLCSIGTVLEPNKVMLKAVGEAVNQVALWKVIVCLHPGDQNFKENPAVYAETIRRMNISVRIVTREEMPTMDAVAGADLVVDVPGSSIGICAASQRKPVICYCSKEALDSLEHAIGTRIWKPCERGLMMPIYNLTEFNGALNQDFSAMVEHQKKALQPAEKGQAVRIMAETLMKYAKK